ncbi:MAG: ATP-binding cassette domain-containing protein, partial [Phycisphaerales bacterium]
MIALQNISVSFFQKQQSVKAVNNVSLQINKGEIFGIVGTSGAGKSTLLRTMNLLQPAAQGHIFIDGNDITNYQGAQLRKIRVQAGMIFQHFNLIRTKTVYHNIAFALKAANTPQKAIDARVTELLAMVNLSDRKNAYPSQLSGGQKQRVGIARALANNPKILLCDEPTSALDLETTNSILDLLKEINQKTGITMVLITHEMAVIKKICDRVAVMSKGVIVETGDVMDIFAAPQHSFTKQLVAYSYDLELPQRLCNDLDGQIFKLIYRGNEAEDPVLSDAAQLFNVKLNILHGKIEYIGNQPLGILLVNIVGNQAEIDNAVNYIRSR